MEKINFLLEGLCEISLDPFRRIMKETISGEWTIDDYNLYVNFYKDIAIEELEDMYQWCKFIYMRRYKISYVLESIRHHLDWCIEKGLVHCIILVSSPIVKIQMRRCGNQMIPITFFYDEDEAYKFLETLYY